MRAFLFGLAIVALAPLPARAANIAPGDAAANVGGTSTVCGTVGSVVSSARLVGHPTYLNFGGAYPHQQFTVTIWGNQAAQLGDLQSLAGKPVCVTGAISSVAGIPSMFLQSASQLKKEPPQVTAQPAPQPAKLPPQQQPAQKKP